MNRRNKVRNCCTESLRRSARQSKSALTCEKNAKSESETSGTDIDKDSTTKQKTPATRVQKRNRISGETKGNETTPGTSAEICEKAKTERSVGKTGAKRKKEKAEPPFIPKSVSERLTKHEIECVMSELKCPLPDFRGREVSITEILSCFIEPNEQQVVRYMHAPKIPCRARNQQRAANEADLETSVGETRYEDMDSLEYPLPPGKMENLSAEELNQYMETTDSSSCAKNLEASNAYIDGPDSTMEEAPPVCVANVTEGQITEIPVDPQVVSSSNEDTENEMKNLPGHSLQRED